LLGVNMDGDPAEAHAASARAGLTWRSWWDGEGRITNAYGIKQIPVFVLIDAQGVVRHKLDSGDVARLEGLIERLLHERE